MNYISTKDLSKLRFPGSLLLYPIIIFTVREYKVKSSDLFSDYWDRDPHSWGNVNDWDHCLIGKQQYSGKFTKQSCHAALADELRDLQKIFADAK
ncbi:hypothetical protein BC937DRAFT_90095 [Endogone sp. FLAS-F59071]|nr:hypothetical protein BC937DRAFT_90095 [Endogone sp. FLAS-F59071]|eukprot:RUS22178.1 hypothetical protein BC937DRAFT_90095 [Endogone sp. FLAS-F59071]